MSDTTTTPIASQPVSQTSSQSSNAPFFWGTNAAAFENLERFEQITNPVGDTNFEFQFEDLAPQAQNQDQKSEFSPDVSSPDLTPQTSQSASVPEFSADDFWVQSPAQNSLPDDLIITPSEQEVVVPEHPDVALNSEDQKGSDDESFGVSEEYSQVVEPNFANDTSDTLSGEIVDLSSQEDWSSNLDFNDQSIPATQDFGVADPVSSLVDSDSPATESNFEESSSENVLESSSDALDQASSDDESSKISPINTELQAHQELEQEPAPERTKLMQKFVNLVTSAKEILRLQRHLHQDPEVFEISGGRTSQSQISYIISLDQNSEIPILHFQKNEIFSATQESQQHLLTLTSETLDHNLQISIDKEPLYVENIDLLEGNKLVFVSEKLNKFEFFFSDKEKELSEQREKIKAEKEKKAWLNAIFRAF